MNAILTKAEEEKVKLDVGARYYQPIHVLISKLLFKAK